MVDGQARWANALGVLALPSPQEDGVNGVSASADAAAASVRGRRPSRVGAASVPHDGICADGEATNESDALLLAPAEDQLELRRMSPLCQ